MYLLLCILGHKYIVLSVGDDNITELKSLGSHMKVWKILISATIKCFKLSSLEIK